MCDLRLLSEKLYGGLPKLREGDRDEDEDGPSSKDEFMSIEVFCPDGSGVCQNMMIMAIHGFL